MSAFIQILNQVFEMQMKMLQNIEIEKIERNINRLQDICLTEGYHLQNPIGEKYTESRTDCEANIIGKLSTNMYITQVIKPIIYQTQNNNKIIVQKGIVMVENK